ncbi:hypothetical protein Tco_0569255 [Tanacetum coccineum]
METQKPLLKDKDSEEVDVYLYRSMIGSLMYLTSSRHDNIFVVCARARYQVNPKVSHLHAMKRIFRYLKGQPKLGLWYPKDSPFDLVAYTNSDYAGASLDRKSTTGVMAGDSKLMLLSINLLLLGKVNAARHKLTAAWENSGFSECKLYKAKIVNGEVQLQALVDGKKIVVTEASVRRDLQLEDADVKQLAKTTAWNEFSSTMASAIICLATNQKFNFSKYIFESMVKNLDSAGKFLMYPRFVQVFLDNQLEGMINHNRIYIAPSHTKKVFANMKRQGKDFSGRVTPLFSTMMVQAQQEQGEGSDMPTDPHHTPTIIPPSTSQPQRKQRPRKPKRKDTEIPQSSVPMENVADEAVYEERDDGLERATTTATGLDVEWDRGNISKTQSKATPNEPSSIGTSSGGGPRCQDTMGDTIAQTRSKNVSKFSNDLLLAGINTPRSGEDSLQLKELMEFCTKLQQRVLDLENTKIAQVQMITSLKKRVKKLERKKKSRTHGLKRLYKVGLSARIDSSDDEASLGDSEDASKQGRKIHDIDADEDITLENVHDADVFGVHDLDGNEVFIETEKHVVNAATTTSTIPVSTAKDLSDVDMTIAQALAELKNTKPKAITTAATITTTIVTRPMTKGLIIQDQEQASTLITSLKEKGNIIIVEEHLKIKKKDQVLFDEQEAIRLQAQFDKEERIAREKEKANVVLTAQWNDIQDKVETDYELAQRLRKFFAAKRVEEKRNKQPTKAQQRSIMTTYLKNMAGWKPKYLKTKSFANVQELFDKAMKMVNTFVDMDTELMEGSETREESGSKRAGGELEQEPSKKKKVDDDKETKELKQCMEIILDDGDDVTIEATPLSTKSPTIVDYKIYKERKKSYFQIIRADVHCVTMQNILYYLLVEKMYPLTKHTLHQMCNDVKLQVDYKCEMAFELLRLVQK